MVTIREGQRHHAAGLARMISDFNVEEGSPGRITVDGVIDLCFEDHSGYKTFVAEDGGDLVGYALVMRYFDTEPCAWCAYMQDLYVVPDRRSQRIGRRLMAAVARSTLEQGSLELVWHVRDHNARGRAFYADIGGKEQTVLPVTLSGDALRRIADDEAG
ncbi:MAG: GNAT family N-acetyltransferase [Alphaproteobacteria bacterium]|nr:GNAT family N-acetyltransferase [Alphaproteobacteria bacterium]